MAGRRTVNVTRDCAEKFDKSEVHRAFCRSSGDHPVLSEKTNAKVTALISCEESTMTHYALEEATSHKVRGYGIFIGVISWALTGCYA